MASYIVAAGSTRRSNIRYTIVAMLFLVTAINYGDRATMSMVGAPMSKQLGLGSVGLGYIFASFSWAYVIGQIPGGWLLDRFGSRRVYFWSILTWSGVTLLQGFVGLLHGIGLVVTTLVLLRFLVGLAEAPSFPGNSRIVAAWFPANERGTASAIFNSAQYFATVLFAPIMGWIIHAINWQSVFFVMGGAGILASIVWLRVIYDPDKHPSVNKAEFAYIEQGGALVRIDAAQGATAAGRPRAFRWSTVRQLFASRMMVGVFIGQYCINALTYFFISWFPVYLVQVRHMSILKVGVVAAIPAMCGFLGGILGGLVSDGLQRRGYSLTVSRKLPIVAGMLLSTSIVVANYVALDAVVIAVMALAFFGKGVGALGWAVMADIAPKEMTGVCAGVFNMIGNLSGVVTPIAIGYIVQGTGSFDGGLAFVGAHAVLAVMSYLVIVGPIRRLELR
ncbi:MFS transporter [Lichenicoccus sp.]|uniref:MFS transporter n=1 Tax=Lichenicoccus sp. TaxID=2781899 RepID=UPI003D135888